MTANWLIVVDMQNGFVNHKSGHIVQAVSEFVRSWNGAGGRVLATRFLNQEGSQWERLIHWRRLRESPETDLEPRILDAVAASERNVVIDKTSYTSLTPEARSLMQLAPAEEVLICGIATDGCVLKTAVDLFESGYTPVVVSDLVSSHAGQEIHEAGLKLIARFVGADQLRRSADLNVL